MKKIPPERIELDLDEAEALLKRVEQALSPEDYRIIKAMIETIHLLSMSVDEKAASIRRLLRKRSKNLARSMKLPHGCMM